MYEITGIKVSSRPPTLGTITDYYFVGRSGEPTTWVNKPQGVEFVRKNPGSTYVSGGGSRAYVEVVEDGARSYLRTIGNSSTSDNLLSLPIY